MENSLARSIATVDVVEDSLIMEFHGEVSADEGSANPRAGLEFDFESIASEVHTTCFFVTTEMAGRASSDADRPAGMNTLTSMTTVAGVMTTFAYDANGNMVSKFGPTKTCYCWNPENLQTSVRTYGATNDT